jgi:hypothetical protein
VNIENTPFVVRNEPWTQNAHEASENQQLGLPLVEFGGDCPIKCFTTVKLPVFNARSGNIRVFGPRQSVGIGPVAEHNTKIQSAIAGRAPVDE